MSKNKKNPKGAGNKLGSVRPKIGEYTSQQDVIDYMTWVKKNYKKNTKLAVWYGDHLFGKATQPVEGSMNGTMTLVFDDSFKK